MSNRIFKGIFLVAMAVAIACLGLFVSVVYQDLNAEAESNLSRQAAYIAAAVEQGGADYLAAVDVPGGSRLTWVAEDGTVLFDSQADSAGMDNHNSRAEIVQARAAGQGQSHRYSDTMAIKTSYCAMLLSDNTVIRVANEQNTLLSVVAGMLPFLIVMVVLAVVASLLLASRTTASIIKPINSIDLENPDVDAVYEELHPLVRRIDVQNMQIHQQMEELTRQHDQQDKLRREFTANVSHELKTPLTSISGFAEIIRDGLVKDEDVRGFAGRIYSEAQRLISLVGDIIKLSQLDEREVAATPEPIDLLETSRAVLSHLLPVAEAKRINISLSGVPVQIRGAEQIIDEIIYNLCDNAIKYNHQGGWVRVHVERIAEGALLEVADGGIGIPADKQARVFERFYRINNSQAEESNGTGLGLSIVKHGAAYHQAKIQLESEAGRGTVIRLIFPVED